MARHHSSVNYVEPNISSAGLYKETGVDNVMSWKVKDDYDRAPRLEDYSIYFNLEVEICSRENISANKTITSDVLVLSYHTKPSESAMYWGSKKYGYRFGSVPDSYFGNIKSGDLGGWIESEDNLSQEGLAIVAPKGMYN